ncbi:hypothetical protein R3P38DRAFT_1121771 [Favolaschia claudopus]|uniref:Uncharacterized protein n=1 Tax=Favolaschia claudopus TaxID=2862362 RepID=A0AAW0BAJ3_9AGAR
MAASLESSFCRRVWVSKMGSTSTLARASVSLFRPCLRGGRARAGEVNVRGNGWDKVGAVGWRDGDVAEGRMRSRRNRRRGQCSSHSRALTTSRQRACLSRGLHRRSHAHPSGAADALMMSFPPIRRPLLPAAISSPGRDWQTARRSRSVRGEGEAEGGGVAHGTMSGGIGTCAGRMDKGRWSEYGGGMEKAHAPAHGYLTSVSIAPRYPSRLGPAAFAASVMSFPWVWAAMLAPPSPRHLTAFRVKCRAMKSKGYPPPTRDPPLPAEGAGLVFPSRSRFRQASRAFMSAGRVWAWA